MWFVTFVTASRGSRWQLVALLALVVSLGGTALAAGKYVVTNVHQIKPSVVKELQAPGRYVITHGEKTHTETGHLGASEALCLPGYHILSGGYSGELSSGARILSEGPTSRGWSILVDNTRGQAATTITARALCAPREARFEGPVE